ncbi:hypothetical protein PHSY_002337 [Pseudozyma hubeiensis SY62]|uniref:Uncharacterized protein n=1 Tax=Pseudozyma hubeiensis (strain SY62) TaxID=1305764 RepID=R9P0V3_PSEHS|nr:hypothetical protein PHSY_002337 [Pseudozyma hubeiensis SY62]GAC94764.1 hypothetical protein PHSY_002337 [Pseudozyma hubeiensis SY62]
MLPKTSDIDTESFARSQRRQNRFCILIHPCTSVSQHLLSFLSLTGELRRPAPGSLFTISNDSQATAHESTPLLSTVYQPDHAEPTSLDSSDAGAESTSDAAPTTSAQQTWLDCSTRQALVAVIVANLLVALGHYVAISSIVDLIRGLSCQEYYLLHSVQSSRSSGQRDCSLVEVQDRTSTIFSYMLSINSFISCLSALCLAPWLLRLLGRRLTMIIAVLAPTAELFVLTSVPNSFARADAWIQSPTASLRLLLLESMLFGLVGCPDTLIGIVSQSIVLDAAPATLRSTWLARLSSCTFLGMLASTLLLNTLSLDTSRDDVSDKLPILLGALVSTAALLWTCMSLPSHMPDNTARQDASFESTNTVDGTRSTVWSLKAHLLRATQPLQLLQPIKNDNQTQGGPKRRDWRLTKLILAATLCDQIALTTNLQVIYIQTRFSLHAQDLSRLLGLVGLIKWVYLVLIFPRIANAIRLRYRTGAIMGIGNNNSPGLKSAAAAADRLIAVISMSIDVLAWAVIIVAGRALNYPTYLLGLTLYALAGANVSSITSLASILLPHQVSTENLVATLSSLANIMSTIGPILNANLYRFGLKRGFPEIVFAMAAAISVAVAGMVAATSPSRIEGSIGVSFEKTTLSLDFLTFQPSTLTSRLHYNDCVDNGPSFLVFCNDETRSATMNQSNDLYDRGDVEIFYMGKGTYRQVVQGDGRKAMQQFLDVLQRFEKDPRFSVKSAHWEPARATIFVRDDAPESDNVACTFEVEDVKH